MKTAHVPEATFEAPGLALLQLHDMALRHAEALHLFEAGTDSSTWRYGYHCHDAWELFCPLRGSLQFEIQGQATSAHEQGQVLLIPPTCLHMAIHYLNQQPQLRVLILALPDDNNPYGTLSIGAPDSLCHTALDADEMAIWTQLIGMPPHELMQSIAADLTAGGSWARKRALARLRLLFSGCGAILEQYHSFPVSRKGQHLAAALLRDGNYLVKEIAEMTGWSSQLYFSAAFNRRYGIAPSALQRSAQTG